VCINVHFESKKHATKLISLSNIDTTFSVKCASGRILKIFQYLPNRCADGWWHVFDSQCILADCAVENFNVCQLPVITFHEEDFKNSYCDHDRWQRSIPGISWKDRITNVEVRARTGQRTMDNILRER